MLVQLLAINAVMFGVEIIGGIIAESSGVTADSLDMLADALVYGVSLFAIGRAGSIKRSAAWWSGVVQLALAAGIVADVVRRAIVGSDPASGLMMAISTIALGANAWCLRLLQRPRHGEVHMRASWIVSRSDVLANLGVLLAGLLVWVTASRWPDLIIGAAIAAVVIKGGLEILREANTEEPVAPRPT